MRKIILAFLFLGFLVLTSSPVYSQNLVREIFRPSDLTQEEEDFSIFSDPAYTKPTHNFSPGQTVYIKVEVPGGGEQEKILRLLDYDKREIKRLTLAHSGSGPYIFTTSFAAPATPGIYYVDIKIKGGGSSFASQENINVGKGCATCSVSSEVEESIIQTEKHLPTISLAPNPTLTSTPTLHLKKPPDVGFIAKIVDFVRTLLSNLTRAF